MGLYYIGTRLTEHEPNGPFPLLFWPNKTGSFDLGAFNGPAALKKKPAASYSSPT